MNYSDTLIFFSLHWNERYFISLGKLGMVIWDAYFSNHWGILSLFSVKFRFVNFPVFFSSVHFSRFLTIGVPAVRYSLSCCKQIYSWYWTFHWRLVISCFFCNNSTEDFLSCFAIWGLMYFQFIRLVSHCSYIKLKLGCFVLLML